MLSFRNFVRASFCQKKNLSPRRFVDFSAWVTVCFLPLCGAGCLYRVVSAGPPPLVFCAVVSKKRSNGVIIAGNYAYGSRYGGSPPLMGRDEGFSVSYTTANIQHDRAAKRRAAKPNGHLILPRRWK